MVHGYRCRERNRPEQPTRSQSRQRAAREPSMPKPAPQGRPTGRQPFLIGLRKGRGGHQRDHRTGPTTAHTLILGDHSVVEERVHARIVAAAGYRSGRHPAEGDLRGLASTRSPNQPPASTAPAVYITEGDLDSAPWTLTDDIDVVPGENGSPTIQFQSRTGQALQPALRHAAQRTEIILVLADNLAWQMVVLITEAGTARPSWL